jgi:pimeloyl-ACP methyl ester carboxylesterase
VYCHPLFEERKCACRFAFQLRNTFQTAGLILETFDYRGTGEAEGEFADVSLETLRQDVSNKVTGDRTCLIGVRLGASLALDYGFRNGQLIKTVVLVAPIVVGSEYVDYLYRKQHIKDVLTGRSTSELGDVGYENFEGYKTSVEFIEQIRRFSLFEEAAQYEVSSLVSIIEISNSSSTDPQIADLARLVSSTTKRISVKNVRVPIFWERLPEADYSELTRKILESCRD